MMCHTIHKMHCTKLVVDPGASEDSMYPSSGGTLAATVKAVDGFL